MARKSQKPLVIAHTSGELLALDRHTDWQIRQDEGGNLYGRRARGGAGFQGSDRTKKGQSRNACRGRVEH
jgi:hypothetical protein